MLNKLIPTRTCVYIRIIFQKEQKKRPHFLHGLQRSQTLKNPSSVAVINRCKLLGAASSQNRDTENFIFHPGKSWKTEPHGTRLFILIWHDSFRILAPTQTCRPTDVNSGNHTGTSPTSCTSNRKTFSYRYGDDAE